MLKPPTRQFQVEIGHLKVIVDGHDPSDAIQEARRQLCEQLPRLWDVITEANDTRFVVNALPN